MSKVRTFTVVALAILAAIVVLQNLAPVEARFLFFTIRAPSAVMLTATLAIGFALGMLVSFGMRRGARASATATRK